MTASRPAAVLWDMDGTLVDTEPYWIRAEYRLVEEFGGTWSHEEALQLVGQGLEFSARILQSKGVALDAEAIVVRLTAEVLEQVRAEVPWRPGARDLLADVRAAGIPMALVTMSRRSLAEFVASCIPGGFDAIVSGDDVANAKPHPEPYESGARALGVEPRDCIAIEDSLPGVTSAASAGTVAIAVPHIVPIPESDAYTTWSSLEGRSLDDLAALMAERSAA